MENQFFYGSEEVLTMASHAQVESFVVRIFYKYIYLRGE